MSDPASSQPRSYLEEWGIEEPDISHLVIEDDEPVDNWYSEKQMALFTDALFASWQPGRPFVAGTDMGLFYSLDEPPYVPDLLLSMDVEHPPQLREKKHKTYLMWEFGKRPDLVVEVVSNINRHEERKIEGYARIGIPYYVIHDPDHHLSQRTVRAFELHGASYVEMVKPWFSGLNLGFTLWSGLYHGMEDIWLRFIDEHGDLLLTGEERAEQAESRAEQAEARARELEARLRELEGR